MIERFFYSYQNDKALFERSKPKSELKKEIKAYTLDHSPLKPYEEFTGYCIEQIIYEGQSTKDLIDIRFFFNAERLKIEATHEGSLKPSKEDLNFDCNKGSYAPIAQEFIDVLFADDTQITFKSRDMKQSLTAIRDTEDNKVQFSFNNCAKGSSFVLDNIPIESSGSKRVWSAIKAADKLRDEYTSKIIYKQDGEMDTVLVHDGGFRAELNRTK